MVQIYTSPVSIGWLSKGLCPECGEEPDAHTGWGGPRGCSLTDTGVARRIAGFLEQIRIANEIRDELVTEEQRS